MTYDHELTLIGERTITKDEIGNEIPGDPLETNVLCGLKSVGRNEFYGAAAAGLKPELAFVIHAYEYDGQQRLRFDGREYRVLRTYADGFEELELTCEKVTGK
jgi:SPP1 family predicted phage head-tail adaptor